VSELKRFEGIVIDCSEFDRFVEEVYGRKYSTVNGMESDMLGHYTYHSVDADQWEYDNFPTPEQIADREAYDAEMREKYPTWGAYERDDEPSVSFEDWMQKDGWDAHNDCPDINEMVYRLRKDGHEVPAQFTVLVDW